MLCAILTHPHVINPCPEGFGIRDIRRLFVMIRAEQGKVPQVV